MSKFIGGFKRRVIAIHAVKIVAIGDSITYGFPYSPEQSWLYFVAKELAVELVNSGVNGDITSGMLSRFASDVCRYKPSHVIIMGGTNDAYEGMEVSQVVGNIKKMVQLARDNQITPLIGLPIPCNDWSAEILLGECREAMQEYAATNDLIYIDFYTAMVDEDTAEIKSGLHCDGVHPNEAGYRLMADVAISALREML